jgi:hypothetical protein
MLGCKVCNKERDSRAHTSGKYQGKNTFTKPSGDIKETKKVSGTT